MNEDRIKNLDTGRFFFDINQYKLLTLSLQIIMLFTTNGLEICSFFI